jgi:hypothetical protein
LACSYKSRRRAAADLDLENAFAGCFVFDDLHVAVLQISGLVRTEPGVRHEQDEVVNLFGVLRDNLDGKEATVWNVF